MSSHPRAKTLSEMHSFEEVISGPLIWDTRYTMPLNDLWLSRTNQKIQKPNACQLPMQNIQNTSIILLPGTVQLLQTTLIRITALSAKFWVSNEFASPDNYTELLCTTNSSFARNTKEPRGSLVKLNIKKDHNHNGSQQ